MAHAVIVVTGNDIRNAVAVLPKLTQDRVLSSGGGGGSFSPQTFQLPPQKIFLSKIQKCIFI